MSEPLRRALAGRRWRQLLCGAWLGWLLAVALLATPAPFATLARADAGRVVARVLAQDAHVGLALGVVVLLLERAAARSAAARGEGSRLSTGMVLALGTLFCTVAGYFALQPAMAAARAGHGTWSFAQLHLLSTALYAVKGMFVAALAWRSTGDGGEATPSQASPDTSPAPRNAPTPPSS